MTADLRATPRRESTPRGVPQLGPASGPAVARFMGNLRLGAALLALGAWLLVFAPVQWLLLRGPLLRVWPAGARRLPHLFHRGVARIIGLRIRTTGHVSQRRPLLIVANHVSLLDIIVLSAVAPVSFVAKAEMVSWPLLGWCARGQRTVPWAREYFRARKER